MVPYSNGRQYVPTQAISRWVELLFLLKYNIITQLGVNKRIFWNAVIFLTPEDDRMTILLTYEVHLLYFPDYIP